MENLPLFKKLTFVLLGLGVIALLGWFLMGIFTNDAEGPRNKDLLRVVTTFFPLYDFTKEIAGNRVDLDILFSQTPEVSSFSPADVQKINRADLLIKNGSNLEPVLDDLVAASDNKNIIVVDTSKGITILTTEETGGYGDPNPHIWLNPQNAIIQVQNIRDALAAQDPQNAEFYRQNSENYVNLLRQLDREIENEVRNFSQKDFIAFHPAFSYFAKRYGLKQAAVIEEFPGKEPAPGYISEIIQTIKNFGVRAIFSEPQFSPRIVKVIAQDLGIEVRELDPAETGDLERDSYISIMRTNLKTLKEAMK